MPVNKAIVGLVAAGMLAACSPVQEDVARHQSVVALLAHNRELAELYQWGGSHQDSLQYMPCPCGCGDLGHTSNVSCFIRGSQDGQALYDDHAIGCQDCQDVARETRDLVAKGKPLKEIRAVIDRTYPGRPTNTALPPG